MDKRIGRWVHKNIEANNENNGNKSNNTATLHHSDLFTCLSELLELIIWQLLPFFFALTTKALCYQQVYWGILRQQNLEAKNDKERQ